MPDLRAALTFLFTVTFAASVLVTDPFSGFRADQLPIPQIDPPIQPEGYAFAIWGLIYAGLIVSALFGLAVRIEDDGWERVRVPLILSLAVGTPWLWIANQSAIWATVTIWIMAGAAIWALLIAPRHDRWLLRAPVALYAGWLTAASCVSLGTVLAGYGIGAAAGMDQVTWAYSGIALALVIALTVQSRVPTTPDYGLTVVWALVGIVVANWPTGWTWAALTDGGIELASGNATVTALAAAGVIIIAFQSLYKASAARLV